MILAVLAVGARKMALSAKLIVVYAIKKDSFAIHEMMSKSFNKLSMKRWKKNDLAGWWEH